MRNHTAEDLVTRRCAERFLVRLTHSLEWAILADSVAFETDGIVGSFVVVGVICHVIELVDYIWANKLKAASGAVSVATWDRACAVSLALALGLLMGVGRPVDKGYA